jgi:glucuronyl esterase-like protein
MRWVALVALSAAFGCGSDDGGAAGATFQPPGGATSPGGAPVGTPPVNSSDAAGNGITPAPSNDEGSPTDAPLVGGQPVAEGAGTTPPAEAPTDEPPVVPPPAGTLGYPENTGAFCDVTAGAYGVENPNLPNPFAMHDGTVISTLAQWTCRRNEIKKDLEEYEIGVKPEPPQVAATFAGGTLSVQVTTAAGSITLTSNVTGAGPCVVIGMNGNSNLVNGCTQVPFNAGQVVQVSTSNSDQPPDDPYYTVYPELWEEAPYGGTPTTNGNRRIGDYSAWSWGISRLIDGLEQVKDQLGIDTSKIAVHGCSYAGKMALFAGALDERVALTIAQESGGGGIPSWRLSEDYNQRTQVDVEKINNTNWSWFKDSMLNPPLNPEQLPHDHHELIAMIAPRPFVALGNPTQSWLSDESGYKSLVAASEVWKAMGAPDRFGYDFNTTNAHCATSASQVQTVNAFVNRFLLDQDVSTSIANPPTSGGFDLNTAAAIDWQTPTLQ